MNINNALHLPSTTSLYDDLNTVAMKVTWTCAQEARRRCHPTGGGTGPVSIVSGPGSDLGYREHAQKDVITLA